VTRNYQSNRTIHPTPAGIHIPQHSLGPDEVHVWRLHADAVADSGLMGCLEGLLAADEAERRNRYVHERTRQEFLLARGLARTVLASYTGLSPHELRFTADAFGKPVLEPIGNPHVHFNLSHSHGVVVCAAALDRHVGIDVEDSGRRLECLDLAERYFAAAEVAHLHRLPVVDRQEAFFAIWTLKEAFVKAIGHGLSFPLDTFAFELERDRLLRFHPPAELPGRWRFFQFEPTPQHRGALAVECKGDEVRIDVRDWCGVFLGRSAPLES
jgi:4'-phosphopantetheinyl transferase